MSATGFEQWLPKSASLTPSHSSERWELGDQVWSRNLATGAFDLVDFRGLGAPPSAYDLRDLATLVGARVSAGGADREAKPVALYPGTFKFSPDTGKTLPEPSGADRAVWLPPFGGDSSAPEPYGLRLTAARLALRRTLTIESLPDQELTLPPAGNYQFLAAAFGTCESRLFALEFSRGLVYHWLPHSRSWLELSASGAEMLAESSLGDNAWGMAAADPDGSPPESTTIFLPTDDGLAIVSINLVAGTYKLRIVGRRCIGAPILWQSRVYVPMMEEGRKLGVYTLDPREPTVIRRMEGPGLDAGAGGWLRPLADRRQIIWMGPTGQLIVKRGGSAALELSLLPWGPGITPRFELGSPYLSGSGYLWQQCFQQDGQGGQGGQFVFVQLGRSEPEIRPASSPRLSTGAACFQLETRLRSDPWIDPDEGMDSNADEVIIPLLESTSASTVLCARVPSTRSVDSVFASNEPCTTTFELRGEQEVRFWVARIPRPWATRPFVHAGHLYLYHPDMRRLPGWRVDS